MLGVFLDENLNFEYHINPIPAGVLENQDTLGGGG